MPSRIFETWEECKAAVDGYPGAEFKGFSTKEEALAYLDKDSDTSSNVNAASLVHLEEPKENQVIAYVDGSFDEKIGKYAFGCIARRRNYS